MSATIPETVRLSDLLKATGYDCPVDLQGKTFSEITEGSQSTGSSVIPCFKYEDSILFAFDENLNFITDKNEVVNAKYITCMINSGWYTVYYIGSENPFQYGYAYKVERFRVDEEENNVVADFGSNSDYLTNGNWDSFQLAEISIVDIITMPRQS